jgi:hypothetical protein
MPKSTFTLQDPYDFRRSSHTMQKKGATTVSSRFLLTLFVGTKASLQEMSDSLIRTRSPANIRPYYDYGQPSKSRTARIAATITDSNLRIHIGCMLRPSFSEEHLLTPSIRVELSAKGHPYPCGLAILSDPRMRFWPVLCAEQRRVSQPTRG